MNSKMPDSVFYKILRILKSLSGLFYLKPTTFFIIYCSLAIKGNAFSSERSCCEKLYIHTDRDYYIAGEDIAFKVYQIISDSSIKSSDIVHVEFNNLKLEVILKTTLILKDNIAHSSISIPDSLSSGVYILKVYTNWMRNFGNEYALLKPVEIINRFGKINKSDYLDYSNNNQYFPVEGSITKPRNISLVQKSDRLVFKIDNIVQKEKVSYSLFHEGKEIKHGQTDSILSFSSLELPDGIIKLLLFRNNENIDSQLFINYKPKGVLQINTTKNTFNKRGKVEIELDLPGFENENISANLSVSIMEDIPNRQALQFPDINDWVTVYSELGNKYNFPYSASELKDSTTILARGNWIFDKMNDIQNTTYPFEKSGHLISGKIVNKLTNFPVSNALVFISVYGSNAYLNYDYTDLTGNFYFLLPVDYSYEQVIVEVWDASVAVANCKIVLDESMHNGFHLNANEYNRSADYFSKTYSNQLKAHEINTLFNKANNTIDSISFSSFLQPIYKGLNQSVFPSDFIKLTNFDEIVREILPGVRYKFEDTCYTIRILNQKQKEYFEQNPLVLINGFPLKDLSLLSALNSEDIKQIDIVPEYLLIGNLKNHGLISIILRKQEAFTIPESDFVKNYKLNISVSESSYSFPDYSQQINETKHLPDFRNTLFWMPELKLEQQSKARIVLYTSDASGDFIINVQGVINNKIPVSAQTKIKVNDVY